MGLSEIISCLRSAGDADESPATSGDSESRESSAVVHECRNCGTTVSRRTRECPACGSEEIVEYPVE